MVDRQLFSRTCDTTRRTQAPVYVSTQLQCSDFASPTPGPYPLASGCSPKLPRSSCVGRHDIPATSSAIPSTHINPSHRRHRDLPPLTGLPIVVSQATLSAPNMFLKTIAAAAILSAAGVDAFWRMECPHRLGLGRIDPLMNPGTVAQHAHAIYGSSGKSSSTSVSPTLLFASCFHIPHKLVTWPQTNSWL